MWRAIHEHGATFWALAGKLVWLQTYFGRSFTSYLIGPDKAACARPGAVLIDDREHGCAEFVRAGGQAIVFPQTWNRHGLLADPVAFVREQLTGISGTVT